MNNWISPEDLAPDEQQPHRDSKRYLESNTQSLASLKEKGNLNSFTLESRPPRETLSSARSEKLKEIVANKCSDPLDITSKYCLHYTNYLLATALPVKKP